MSNDVVQIIRFFQSDGKLLGPDEFREFWDSLSEDELDYYENVNLKTGLLED